MKKGTELTASYPNGAKFQQLAIDNTETEYAIRQLDLQHKAARLTYSTKLAELEQYRKELAEHTGKENLSDYEEGKRRQKVEELTEKIKAFEAPEPVNAEMYRVHRQMLEHKLRETAQLNAAILIWQGKANEN